MISYTLDSYDINNRVSWELKEALEVGLKLYQSKSCLYKGHD
jgi:hypothetical protein